MSEQVRPKKKKTVSKPAAEVSEAASDVNLGQSSTPQETETPTNEVKKKKKTVSKPAEVSEAPSDVNLGQSGTPQEAETSTNVVKKKKKTLPKSAEVSDAASDVNLGQSSTPQDAEIPSNEVKKKKKKKTIPAEKKTSDDAVAIADNDDVALQETVVQASSDEAEESAKVLALLSLSEKEAEDNIAPLKETSQRISRPSSRSKKLDKLNATNSDKLAGKVSTLPPYHCIQ